MTGPDQGSWLRAELAAGVEDLSPSVAPIDRIEQGGRRARRRRTALIGASVAAVIAVAALTAASLSGSSTRATGPAHQAPSAPTGVPTQPETPTTEAEVPPRNPIATGEFAGHRWELVHSPENVPQNTPQTGAAPYRCDVVEVFLDGHLDNRGGSWCATNLRSTVRPGVQPMEIASVAVGDTALYRPGVGYLGTITFGQVSAEVASVTARFDNDKAPITVKTAAYGGGNDTRYFTIQVPGGAGYSVGGSLHMQDAQGREIEAVSDIALGAAK
ncbi:hypothetical protein [Embleya scabrispora]|uniref:hypothetical protein n=1 Tax=Embleya scabrispora TaxID=159449 RepID=UPI0003A2F716|nr:hypothetical protein [Embleya scabrispora]MYS87659.1 hypothetical protein [Streptomyces sp. SID5474]